MKPPIYFDFESGPLPEELLSRVRPPFDPASMKGFSAIGKPFNPLAVKTGNIKDPVKIEQKITAARDNYAVEQKELIEQAAKAETDYVAKFAERAALDACRGQLLAIGYLSDKQRIDDRDEQTMLCQFWHTFNGAAGEARKMIGFNIFGFDLPFIIRRSWVYGLHVPAGVINKNRYWHDSFVDLAEVYRLGCHGEFKSLGEMSVAMGIGEKLDGVSGADFHKLWAEDRPKAMEYLGRDLELTKKLAERILPHVE